MLPSPPAFPNASAFTFLTLGYHPDLVGGAYRYVAEIAEGLARRGHGVRVVCPNPNPDLPSTERRRGVQILRYPNFTGFFLLNWLRENAAAQRALEAPPADGAQTGLVVLCHAFLSRAVRHHWDRTAFLFTGPWHAEFLFSRDRVNLARQVFHRLIARSLRRTEARALRNVRQILTISRYYERMLPRWHASRLAPVTMISGGVNLEVFQPDSDREALRAHHHLSPNHFVFLAVRRLDPRMGLLPLIDGFGAICRQFPKAELWLAGQGPQRDLLRARIEEQGLTGRVRLLGFVPESDLPALLTAADCTVMPSLDLEGLGLATLESLACGTPVIGSRAGATPEILEPLDSNLLFDIRSPSQVAAKLRALLAGQLALPDRRRCRDYVEQTFSWNRPIQALEACHRQIVSA